MRLPLATFLLVAACSDGAAGLDPDTAPVASVDRFSDDFGTLFRRSAPVFDPANVQPSVPAPNEPIDLDALFTVRALGPSGQPVTYYSLDILPRVPAQAWVITRGGQPVAEQLPIIDLLPGDSKYNDFAQINEVEVGDDYEANTFTSKEEVDAAAATGEVTVTPTSRLANWAAVPAGSTATRRFLGEEVTGHRSWIRGAVVHQLRFEENLTATSGGNVPAADIIVMFDNNMDPSQGFEQEADGSTHNSIDTVAGDPGYSSLWNHSVGDNANFDAVVDYPSALANVMAADVGVDVNCPEVR